MLIPKTLTLLVTFAGLALMLLAARMAFRGGKWRPDSTKKLEDSASGSAAETNRWIGTMRGAFLLLIVAAFAFHSYWAFFADKNPRFARAKQLDARNRRLAESWLKGWVLDRS